MARNVGAKCAFLIWLSTILTRSKLVRVTSVVGREPRPPLKTIATGKS